MYFHLLNNTKTELPENDIIEFALLAEYLEQERQKYNDNLPEIIIACVGTPTFYASPTLAKGAMEYWQNILNKTLEASKCYHDKYITLTNELVDKIVCSHTAIDYANDPCGDIHPKSIVANYLIKHYESNINISEENIIFTVGATAGLNSIFEIINEYSPDCKIITPFPYYWIYKGKNNQNNLHPIYVMNESGYKLNAQALKQSLLKAEHDCLNDGKKIGAFLFCDPNNPLGTVLGKSGWKEIAKVLRETLGKIPNIWIILDESYAGMQFNGKYVSLLTVAPDLKDRIIIINSGTKTLSAAGERVAFMTIFNKKLNNDVKRSIISSYIHAPRSLQAAYAHALANNYQKYTKLMSDFYKTKVEYVSKRLREIGISMPDSKYLPEGTFYIIADCREFLGIKLQEEFLKALDYKISSTIKTSMDIALYLLFYEGIALAPLSCFGVEDGYIRITCSDQTSKLIDLTNRLENRIKKVRTSRK